MLASGSTIPLDGITIAILAFALWLTGSVFWTRDGWNVLELLLWFSYFLLFTAARTIPMEVMAWMLLPNAAVFSALQLYYQFNKAKSYEGHKTGLTHLYFPVFGNSNHQGAFLLVGLYAALWLALKTNPLLWLFVGLIALAIARSRCRSAMAAMVISVMCAAFSVQAEILFYVAGVIVILALSDGKRFYQMAKDSPGISERLGIYGDALKRIHPRYLTGRGLNYFRAQTGYGRVHNDHLEIIGEVGIIGYILFINIFLQMPFDPFILSVILAYFISGMFFYPFREVHTAAPFWSLLGSGAGISLSSSFLLLKIIGILVILTIMIFVFTVFCNLMDWKVSELKKSEVT